MKFYHDGRGGGAEQHFAFLVLGCSLECYNTISHFFFLFLQWYLSHGLGWGLFSNYLERSIIMVKYCIFIQGEGGIKYADKTDVAKMGGGPPKF